MEQKKPTKKQLEKKLREATSAKEGGSVSSKALNAGMVLQGSVS